MHSGQFSAKINQYLTGAARNLNPDLLAEMGQRAQVAFRRQFMEERQSGKGILRMSAGGTCARKQWYNYTGAKGEPLSARVQMNFLLGDLCELGLVTVARLAGWQITEKFSDQGDEVFLTVGNHRIPGHIDGLLYEPEEGADGYHLLECKKMSEYGFREFEKEGVSDIWGYRTQMCLYMRALGVKHGIMAAYCGNTGHIADHVIEYDQSLVDRATAKWRSIINGQEPAREYQAEAETKYNRSTKQYEPTGRKVLGIVCSYCGFRSTCWPEAKQEFKGEKPIWVVK